MVYSGYVVMKRGKYICICTHTYILLYMYTYAYKFAIKLNKEIIIIIIMLSVVTYLSVYSVKCVLQRKWP
jgi:hypothetical protein